MTKSCYANDELDRGHRVAIYMGIVSFLRFVLANVSLWVTWKRGASCWIKIGPTVMYLITLSNYILIPLGGLIWYGVKWAQI